MAGRPVTDAEQKHVIILINHAAHQAVPIPQVLVPAALTRFLTAAAELAEDVNLAVTHLLLTGAPFIQPAMVIAVRMGLLNLVTRVVAVQGALPEEAEVLVVDPEVEAAPVAPAVATTVRATVMLPFPAARPDVVTEVRSKENTGPLRKLRQQKNAVAAAQSNLLAAAFPATLAEQFIMMGICPVTRLKAKHQVPAAHLTPDKAAAVAKQQKPLCFQRGFSFYQTHTNQNYRLSLKYSLAFLYFPV